MRQLDPAARRVLEEMTTTHQALFSFSAQLKVEAISDSRHETATASLVYMKPNKARVSVRRSDGTSALSVCDGSNRFYIAAKTRKKVKTDAGEKGLLETLSEANLFIAPVFFYLTSRSAPVRTILPGTAKVLGFGTPLTLDGVAVEVIAADVETPQGRARLIFSLGKEDRLLRRLEVNTSYQKQNLSLVETYTEVKSNPKLDKRAFLAP